MKSRAIVTVCIICRTTFSQLNDHQSEPEKLEQMRLDLHMNRAVAILSKKGLFDNLPSGFDSVIWDILETILIEIITHFARRLAWVTELLSGPSLGSGALHHPTVDRAKAKLEADIVDAVNKSTVLRFKKNAKGVHELVAAEGQMVSDEMLNVTRDMLDLQRAIFTCACWYALRIFGDDDHPQHFSWDMTKALHTLSELQKRYG